MYTRVVGLLAGIVCVVALSGCGTAAEQSGGHGAGHSMPAQSGAPSPARQADPAAFQALVAQDGVTVVNVHVPDEGSIAGTDKAIPYTDVAARAGELPADRAAPLAIYCMTGPMSTDAARTLAGMGYTNVTELTGGMQAWRDSGRPLLPA